MRYLMRRPLASGLGRACASLLLTWIAFPGGEAFAQTASQAVPSKAQPPAWTFSIRDTLRFETWRFFQPVSDAPDPTYAFLGNRLQLEARFTSPRAELTLTAQHVGLVGLPERASGPGPFGTGALYYAQGGNRRNSQQLYPRYANLRLRGIAPGVDLQVGRMAYTSGAEAASGVAKVESVKRQRLNARLVGEFEWSLYQRGYDGVRVDWTRAGTRATGIALMPTQGGFAKVAAKTMTDVLVAGGAVSHTTRRGTGGTELQGFVLRYADTRPVTGRPDNTGRPATAVDVAVTTTGGALIGAYPAGAGEADLFGWVAIQRGRWYGDSQQAFAIAGETGFQWTAAPLRPWLRAGVLHASGDADASDATHGTFFPMLPTMRRFSQTTVYSTMNLDDLFAQVMLRPRPSVGIRVDVHRLWLASSADLWYAGSGATLTSGGGFGYAGRPSNGARSFGTSLEASVNVAVTDRWSVEGFASHLRGGPVVSPTFRGRSLWFGYVETILRLDR